jgi:Ca-activated chloride channel family protein
MRRADAVVVCLVAVVTCLLLVVPGAAAVASAAGGGAAARERATPVAGGGGFADAPSLDAGVYGDTLLPRETLFYAVALRSGERLRARATVDVSVGSRSVQDIPDASAAFPEIRVFTPLRQQVPSEDLAVAEAGDDLEALAVEVVAPRVLTAAAAGRRAAGNEYWTGPGVYHIALTMSQITRALGATVEFPLRLAIDVDGRRTGGGPPARASPGPLGDWRAGASTAARARARSRAASSDEPVGAGLLAAGGAGGILVGAAAGWSLGARRRCRPP